jgi:uncharacterized membrane protein YsdA (DUF1294 family)
MYEAAVLKRWKSDVFWTATSILGSAGFLAGVGELARIGWLQWSFVNWYFGVSAFTFLLFGKDKLSAKFHLWRTADRTLKWLSLVGGWPGGWPGQWIWRNKIRGDEFHTVMAVSIVLHLCLVAVSLLQSATLR